MNKVSFSIKVFFLFFLVLLGIKSIEAFGLTANLNSIMNKNELVILSTSPNQNTDFNTDDNGTLKLKLRFNKDIDTHKIKDLYKENFFYAERFGKVSVNPEFISFKYNSTSKILEYTIKYSKWGDHSISFNSSDFIARDGSSLKPFKLNFYVNWTGKTSNIIDFDYFIDALKTTEPEFIKGFNKPQLTLIKKYRDSIRNDMKGEDFFLLLNSLISGLKVDGMNIQSYQSQKYIKLPIKYINKQMIAFMDSGEIKKGDILVEMGNKKLSTLLNEFKKYYSNFTESVIKRIFANHIIEEKYLRNLKLITKDRVSVIVERDGGKKEIFLPLTNENIYVTMLYSGIKKSEECFKWNIEKENNLGILSFDYSVLGTEEKEKINNFFASVSENRVSNIILDLRNYSGGRLKNINDLLKYLTRDEYLSNTMIIRHSQYTEGIDYNKKINKDEIISKNIIKVIRDNTTLDHIFQGNIYVIIPDGSCSEAINLAAIMQNYNVKIIGEESSYNCSYNYMDVGLNLPYSNFVINFSSTKVMSPNYNSSYDTLMPAIIVNTTAEDFFNNKDPQLDKIREIIKTSPLEG